jgi:hypothetical protein
MPRNAIRLISGHARHKRMLLSSLTLLGAAFVILGVLLAPSLPAMSQAQFGDPAFRTQWERTDGAVASGAAQRGWIWGPVPGQTLSEPFNGLPGNAHQVQYFDKGRMEINNPNGNKSDPFYVTNGLLAVELISGQEQTGLNSYVNLGPAPINLASDSDDPSAPTYQSFNGVANIPGAPNERKAQSAVGQPVKTAIDRLGRTQAWPSDHSDYGVRIAYFEPTTGHNIPDVFWDYLNGEGTIIQDGKPARGALFSPWFAVTGYPISEPYWAYVKVAGQYTDVMVQAYERRVLTFVPHFQVGFKVQMGNIGQHYFDWRYKNTSGTPQPGGTVPTPTAPAQATKASVRLSDIAYRKSITDINGNQIKVTNTGQSAILFNGWWLDSPKWDHVDRFYFPPGITLAPGAALTLHAGVGVNTATDVYMRRTSVMWDGQPYDLAIIYDNLGREIDRFFPAADTGAPPATATLPPTATLPVPVGSTPTPTLVPGKTETVPAGATATPTPEPPTPVPTSGAALR